MKIIKFGAAGKMVRIGEESRNSIWYKISDTVRPFLIKMAEGDDVTIRSEKQNGMDVLVHISKGNGDVATDSAPVSTNRIASKSTAYVSKSFPQPATDTGKATTKTYGKSPEEQDSIKRQAIGNMASRSLIALQGQVTVENIGEVTRAQYALFQELVG